MFAQVLLHVVEAAAGLSGANLSVLNGADGLGEIASGLVAQGLTIFDSVKKSINGGGSGPHGASAQQPAASLPDGKAEADGQAT